MRSERTVERTARRSPRLGAGIALVLALAVGFAGPVAAEVPRPLVPLLPPLNYPDQPAAAVGQTSTGVVFYVALSSERLVVTADPGGTHHALGVSLSSSSAVVGPDDRLWGVAGSTVRAVTTAGAVQDIPVPVPSGGAAPTPDHLATGPDGRMWFLDAANRRIGAVDTDGTDLVSWPAGGTADPTQLTRGPDGRLWFTRDDGSVATATTAGAVSDLTTLPAATTLPLTASGGYVWAVVGEKLVKIAPSGVQTVVSTIVSGATGLAAANGRVWVLEWNSSTPGPQLLSAGPTGSAALTPVPTPFAMGFPDPFSKEGFLQALASIAPDHAGTGLIGTLALNLWSFPYAALGPRLTVTSATVASAAPGVRNLVVKITGRLPNGLPHTGTVRVALWFGDSSSVHDYARSRRGSVTAHLSSAGTSTVLVPVVPSMIDVFGFGVGGHDLTAVAAEIAGGGTQGGASSPLVAPPPITLPPEMAHVAKQYAYLLDRPGFPNGNPIDDSGALYWSKRLGAGTSRTALASSITASTTWRRQRVKEAYATWLLRAKVDPGGLDYWTRFLSSHTAAQLDLAIAGTAGARDAAGTSNSSRARHLATALGTNRQGSYLTQLQTGTSWTRILNAAYAGPPAIEARAARLLAGTRIASTTSSATQAQVVAKLNASSDERGALALVASTLR